MRYAPHTFDDFAPGQTFTGGPRTVTQADIAAFAELSGDHTALHADPEYARTTPFGGVVAHGALVLAVGTGLAYELGIFEGTVLAVRSMDVAYERPVRPGDALSVELRVESVDERPRPDRGRARFLVVLTNQHGKAVLAGTWTLVLRRRPPDP